MVNVALDTERGADEPMWYLMMRPWLHAGTRLLGNKGTKQASLISLLNESETKEGRTQTQRLGHT